IVILAQYVAPPRPRPALTLTEDFPSVTAQDIRLARSKAPEDNVFATIDGALLVDTSGSINANRTAAFEITQAVAPGVHRVRVWNGSSPDAQATASAEGWVVRHAKVPPTPTLVSATPIAGTDGWTV